jgi:hypothetical protein
MRWPTSRASTAARRCGPRRAGSQRTRAQALTVAHADVLNALASDLAKGVVPFDDNGMARRRVAACAGDRPGS